MIEIGKRQTLVVDSENSSGFNLHCGDAQEVFMPGTLAPAGLKVGDRIEVFVFLDSKGDEIATATLPRAEAGDFACLTVKDVTHHGAFLDIGLPKDILLPNKLQKYEKEIGGVYLVKVLLDDEDRLYATEKIGPYVETQNIPLKPGDAVKLTPFHRTPLGFKVLIDNKYLGMIYHNEIFKPVEIGKEREGTVKTVRSDGQIDALLMKIGKSAANDNCAMILRALQQAGGRLNFSDRSPPEDIRQAFGISKKAYKNAIGTLKKQQLIEIKDTCIEVKSAPQD